MDTDITRGLRICPSCGGENAAAAASCRFCFTSLDRGIQSTPSLHTPAAFTEPSPFQRFYKAPLWNPGYTGTILILICFIFGIATCGLGFLLFIPLAPALYRLHRAAQHLSADYETYGAGFAALGAGAVLALLVAASAVITFGAVCYPIGAVGFNYYPTNDFMVIIVVLATVLGLLVAGAVAYVIVRAIFPPHDRRNSDDPRPSPSNED